ncbi:MAG TPA: Nramp family divalent metal transporter, partial [Bacteroidales bacterium]|nr:Nramp family divalent metal transporter [Bacteroidales bacterium]
ASNLAAGADYGYQLLWMVTLSTIMLIVLQHNVAHLGIATGLCLSEAATMHMPRWLSRSVLSSAIVASVSTSLAELLGGAIALHMLFGIPIKIGAVITLITILILLFSNSYRKLEKWIIGFVSLIGLSFVYELTLADISWSQALVGWVKPSFPEGSMVVIMSVLGAVVMPHNLFLHSEIIQSRQWNLTDESIKRKQLRFEFLDTLFSMIVGWAINSAMILMAAATFFKHGIVVNELQQAKNMLAPLLGNNAAVIFAAALLMAGVASTITSAMAGGSIFAGFFGEPFDMKDNHSRLGVLISLIPAVLVIFLISDPFKGLIYSQMLLSIQLPITIFTQIYLTSSRKVMGEYSNSGPLKIYLLLIGGIVTFLNIRLLMSIF